jgi:hypothetical protein
MMICLITATSFSIAFVVVSEDEIASCHCSL